MKEYRGYREPTSGVWGSLATDPQAKLPVEQEIAASLRRQLRAPVRTFADTRGRQLGGNTGRRRDNAVPTTQPGHLDRRPRRTLKIHGDN